MAFVVPSIMVASGMRIHLPACVALRPGARVKQRLFANVGTSYLPMETLVGGIQLSTPNESTTAPDYDTTFIWRASRNRSPGLTNSGVSSA